MIDVDGLVFDHPTGRTLRGLSFVVRAGAVVGVVGPPGSGKSTLIRCIATLETPESGRITVAGRDTERDPQGVHALIGYVPAVFGLYDALSVGQCLRYAARSRGVAADGAAAAAVAAAEAVGLAARMPTPAGALSGPERRRLALAQAIVHRPRVLLLDEPAPASDPAEASAARAALGRLVAPLARAGMTVMLSAPTPRDLPDGCDGLLELEGGRLVGEGVRPLAPPAAPAERAPPEAAAPAGMIWHEP